MNRLKISLILLTIIMASRFFQEPTDKNPKYPCGICAKIVSQRHKAIQCDTCNYWNHIKCNEISDSNYEI